MREVYVSLMCWILHQNKIEKNNKNHINMLLRGLGKEKSMPGQIITKSQNKIQDVLSCTNW